MLPDWSSRSKPPTSRDAPTPLTVPSISRVHATSRARRANRHQRAHHRGVVDLVDEILVVDQPVESAERSRQRRPPAPGFDDVHEVGERDADKPAADR